MTARLTLMILLLAALLGLGACGEEDNPVVPPVVTPPGFASPDHLVAAFHQAYEDLDLDLFAQTLHPDYAMLLQPTTTQEFPAVGTTLDRAEELRIAARMFGGQTVTGPQGNLLPAISAISFAVLEQQGVWQEVPDGQPFAGTRAAIFDVVILCNRPQFSTLKSSGPLKFFAAANDTNISGQDFTYWQMRGMQDLTGFLAKGVEETTWGSIKALFWVAE